MIHEPLDTFDFNQLRLLPPKSTHGVFLAKCQFATKPLYIQPPKCGLKSVTSVGNKKPHMDLMFDAQENVEFIRWMEKLEQEAVKQLFDRRSDWFETDLEMTDIENSFTSPLKSFKSGKYYVLRAHIYAPLGKSTLKIYDEHENEMNPEFLKENQQVVTILEIQGVRCSTRCFQWEIELKQMMVLEPETQNLFERCLLGTAKPAQQQTNFFPNLEKQEIVLEPAQEIIPNLNEDDVKPPPNQGIMLDPFPTQENETSLIQPAEVLAVVNGDEPQTINLEFDDLSNSEQNPPLTLKNKKEIYYELYRDAKKKAKEARDLALSTYLEACKIKNTYSLDDLTDSDED